MPQVVIAAAAWIGEAVFTVTSSATLAAAAANTVAALGFAQGVGAALTAWSTVASLAALAHGKPRIGGDSGTQVDFKADPTAGIPYPIGETGTGGQIVYANTAEAKNQHLLYLTVLGGVPIEAFTGFQVNGVAESFTGENANSAQYHNRMWQRNYLGTLVPTAFDPPATTLASFYDWTAAHKVTGLAASWWVLEYDAKTYSTGTPKPLWVIKGAKVYDPRLDSTYPGGAGPHRANDETTWTWSANPFLNALAWVLGRFQNGKRILGLGAAIAAINVPAFAEGANVADANGWKVGGVVYSTDSKFDVLDAMLRAGGGWYVGLGAKISCGVNTPRVSLATMTIDDAAGGFRVSGIQPRRDRINGVIPSYRSAAHGYEVVPATRIGVPAYEAADGQQRTKEIQWPLVPEVNQVAQLARYAIEDSREFGPIVIPCKPRWMGYGPNDCFTISEPEWNLVGQKVLILKRDRDPSTGIVTLTLRSETDGKHPFALGQTGTPPPAPGLTTLDPSAPGQPGAGAFVLNGATLATVNGSIPVITVTGATDDLHAAQILVRYRPVGGPAWTFWPAVQAAATRIEITGVTQQTVYEAEVAYQSVRGVTSPWTALGTATAGVFDGGQDVPSSNLWRKQDYVVTGAATSIAPAFGVAKWGVRFTGAAAGAATVSGKIQALTANGGRYSFACRHKLTTGAGTATIRCGWRTAAGAAITDIADQVIVVSPTEARFEWNNIHSADPNFVNAKFQVFVNAADVAAGKIADVADLMVVYGNKAPLGFSPSPDDPEGLKLFGFTGDLNATHNTIWPASGAAPGGAVDGDIWPDNSTSPLQLKMRLGGAWVLVSSLGGVFGSTLYTTAGGSVATLSAFQTSLGIASAISGQGAWATASVPGGLTPTQVNGRTQWFNATDGKLYDYRGLLWGLSVDSVAGRGSQPLTSSYNTISIAAHDVYFPTSSGTTTIHVAAHTFSGLADDTNYAIFYRPDFGDFFAPASVFAPAYVASIDGYMLIGYCRTPIAYSGTPNPTYTDPTTGTPVTASPTPTTYAGSGVDSYCVDERAWLSHGVQAKDVRAGDAIVLMEPAGDFTMCGEVTRNLVGEDVQCFRLTSELGAVLTVSETTPIMVRKGPGYLPRAITIAELKAGMQLPHLMQPDDDEVTWGALLRKRSVGRRRVCRISAGNGIYPASDNRAGPFLLTHNFYNKA